MEQKKKEIRNKFRKASSTSSSSCSSGSTSDDSSSSSSSSRDSRHKMKRHYRRRETSTTAKKSSGVKMHKRAKVESAKKVIHKKSSHGIKIRKKSASGHMKKGRSVSPATEIREKVRMREKEKERRSRSRTPTARRVSPRREAKKDRSPERRISSPSSRFRVAGSSRQRSSERSSSRNINITPGLRRHDILKDRERREKEKEQAELMARNQERQRERERKERMRRERSHEDERHKGERLLQRTSDRSRMLNTSRGSPDNKLEHERSRSHSRGRSIRDRLDVERGYGEHPLEREEYMIRGARDSPYLRERVRMRDEYGEADRGYDHREERRPIPDYARIPYEDRHRRESWDEHDAERGRIYDRGGQLEPREWDRDIPPNHSKNVDENYKEPREWGERQWSEQEKWPKEKDPKDWKQYGDRSWPESEIPHKRIEHVPPHSVGPIPPHPAARRWPPSQHQGDWPGPPKGESHAEYRKSFHPHPSHPHPHPIKPSSIDHPGGPHPYKRHPVHHPYNFNYKRFHFTRKLHPNPKFNPALKAKMMHTNQAPQNPNLIIAHVQKTPTKTEITAEQPALKKAEIVQSVGAQVLATDEVPTSPSAPHPTTTTVPFESGNVEADTTINEAGTEEDNLSNVSDSDDEILNREEELAAQAAQNASERAGHDDKDLETSREEGQIDDVDENRDSKDISKIHANEELKKEMDLDFEEISDGELEEETKNKGYGDAVGVDWSVLAKETQRPVIRHYDDLYDSIKTRWTPHRILWDIGISVNLAGEEFARKTLLECREKLKIESLERKLKIKKELANSELSNIKLEENSENKITIKTEVLDSTEVKEEPKSENQEEDDQLSLDDDDELLVNEDNVIAHPLANMQVILRKQKIQRKNLIMNATGKYGRALSARRDLKIRRQLCNLPPKEVFVDRSCIQNAELKQKVENIFQKLINGAA